MRAAYREAERTELMKSDVKRARHELLYSDNIVIHYTVSTSKKDGLYRVKAYVKTPGPNSVIIKETVRRISNIPYDQIENWLTDTYPFLGAKSEPESTVQHVLAKNRVQFMFDDISLKSYIYLTPSITVLLPNYCSEILQFLMNTRLAEYPVRNISDKHLQSFLQEYAKYCPAYSPRQLF